MQHMAKFVHNDGVTVYADTMTPDTDTGKPPVVMVHGGGHTGACYLLTADNRPGWAYRFVAAGYPVWIPDWPGCGRSGDVPLGELGGDKVCAALGAVIAEAARNSAAGQAVLMGHSMGGALTWKLVETQRENIARVVGIAPGPPGNIQPEANVVSETETEIVVRSFGMTRTLYRDRSYAGGPEFVSHKLIGKSSRFPKDSLDLYAGHLAAVPPRLIIERQNVRGAQLRIRDSAVFRSLPVLVMTGANDTDHPKEVDGAVVAWLEEAGALADFCWLPDRGIGGNGHMLMMEDNSDELADMIVDWLEGAQTAGAARPGPAAKNSP